MSYHADEEEEVSQPRDLKQSVWMLVVFVSIFSAVFGLYAYLGRGGRNDYVGEMSIEPDLDTRIYLGNKLVGTTQVSFTWEELFGDESYQATMLDLPYPAGATPELVSGSGAKFLYSRQLSGRSVTDVGESGQVITVFKVSGDEFFVRRANSSLDHVIALVIEWTPPGRPHRRILLPLRVRKGQGDSTVYFFGVFGTSSGPGHASLSQRFTAWGPPDEFTEEIKTKGLWEPEGK